MAWSLVGHVPKTGNDTFAAWVNKMTRNAYKRLVNCFFGNASRNSCNRSLRRSHDSDGGKLNGLEEKIFYKNICQAFTFPIFYLQNVYKNVEFHSFLFKRCLRRFKRSQSFHNKQLQVNLNFFKNQSRNKRVEAFNYFHWLQPPVGGAA